LTTCVDVNPPSETNNSMIVEYASNREAVHSLQT